MKKHPILYAVLLMCFAVQYAWSETSTASQQNAKSESANTGRALVEKVIGSEANIVKTFPGYKNLEGFVMKPKQGGREMILYADKNGEYLLVGALISKEGENLTSKDTYTYILSSLYKKSL